MKTKIEWFVETILVIVHFPTFLLKPFINFNAVNKNPTQKYSIILVERWFDRNVFHLFAKKYLEKKGFTVYSINYPLSKGTFEDAAKSLDKFINEKKLDSTILIGISGGATTCLYYLQFLSGWTRTKKFISIGGSLKGSALANSFPFYKSIRELRPESEFLKKLYSSEVKNKERIITISAEHDNVVPSEFSKLEGAENITLPVVGHNLLHTFWAPTYELVAKLAGED